MSNSTRDKSTLVQVMVWCRQATNHYWANVDTDICRYRVSLGHNELIMLGIMHEGQLSHADEVGVTQDIVG